MTQISGQTVAFLGLGIMGASMAANLARAGATVLGWNRTQGKAGAEIAAKANVTVVTAVSDAVREADFVFSCVGDERDAEDLLVLEVAPKAKAGALFVDFSTIGPTAAKKISTELSRSQPGKNLRFLDAPVTGGDVGAKEGTLTILVGGDKTDFDQCKPLLDALGKRIVYCGSHGAGQAMKLCNQILCAVNMIAVSEAFALANEMDISPELLLEALSQGAGGSWALSNLGQRIARSDYAPGFTLEHMLKDLRLVEENSGEANLPGTHLAIDLFGRAQKMGMGAGAKTEGSRQGTQAMFRVYDEKLVLK